MLSSGHRIYPSPAPTGIIEVSCNKMVAPKSRKLCYLEIKTEAVHWIPTRNFYITVKTIGTYTLLRPGILSAQTKFIPQILIWAKHIIKLLLSIVLQIMMNHGRGETV